MSTRSACFILCSVLCLFSGSLFGSKLLTGTIEGANYQIKLPEVSNGRLLLLAHGYRPETAELAADIGSSHTLYDDLVAEGWIVATTSYRRNGWIMEDAAEDIISLRDFIFKSVAQPKKVYLAGNSMGGGIVTWIAEHAPGGFDAGLAMGAYLFEPIMSETERSTKLADYYSGQPNFPILYLTNTSELEGPMAYIELASDAEIKPVLWKVQRFGHVNLNYSEEKSGIFAIKNWAETGMIEADKDGTILMHPGSSASFVVSEATSGVHSLVPVYGNVISQFVAKDLELLGLKQGDFFTLAVGGQEMKVLFGSDYGDVAVGDWVAFFNAEGYLLICRNYKDAVGTLGLTNESHLTIRPL